MSPLEATAALTVALVWGVQFVAIKNGLDVFPPLFFVALRFAAVGAILLPFASNPARRDLEAAALISLFFGGLCFNVLIKRLGPFNIVRLMSWMSLFTVPQVGLASVLLEHGQIAALQNANMLAWLSLGHTIVFGAIVAFGLWFWLIGRRPLAQVAPFALLQTVFAIGAGVFFLHEPLGVPLLAGTATCVAGVVMTQLVGAASKTTTHQNARSDGRSS